MIYLMFGVCFVFELYFRFLLGALRENKLMYKWEWNEFSYGTEICVIDFYHLEYVLPRVCCVGCSYYVSMLYTFYVLRVWADKHFFVYFEEFNLAMSYFVLHRYSWFCVDILFNNSCPYTCVNELTL